MEAEETEEEKTKLKATIAEFLFNEICGKAQRLAEGAAKCVRDMQETKVLVFYFSLKYDLNSNARRQKNSPVPS